MNPIQKYTATAKIKDYALKELGFSYCGIARAAFLEEEARNLEMWLKNNYHGEMAYMADHFDMRLDPRLLIPGARSVITLLCNYYPEELRQDDQFLISKYAYGKDYHKVIRKKLKKLLQYLQSELGAVEGRGFVDSAPVMERAWARRSGLGWTGKNALHITRQQGSFFFIATLIVDIDLEYDDPMHKDYCGTCTKCIDSCPTQAIIQPSVVDAQKCISYLTIELKKETIPSDITYDNWVFGCDICQDVCPWNRFSKPHKEEGFSILDSVRHFDSQEILKLKEEEFMEKFQGSPIKRTKLEGLKKNIRHILRKSD